MRHLAPDERTARALCWRERYEQGATADALAAAAGVSNVTVARAIRSVGGAMRPGGNDARKRLPARGLSVTPARRNGKRRHRGAL